MQTELITNIVPSERQAELNRRAEILRAEQQAKQLQAELDRQVELQQVRQQPELQQVEQRAEIPQAEQQAEQQAESRTEIPCAEPLYFTNGEVEVLYLIEMEPRSLESMLENLRGKGLHEIECLIMARAADSFETEFTAKQWMEKVRDLLIQLGICHELDADQRTNEIFQECFEEVCDYGVNFMVNAE